MNAMVFPGQGAQFPGMGQDLFDGHAFARDRFAEAAEVLGFDIADIMFNGSDEDLKQTKVTQPAIFLHSVILAEGLGDRFQPDFVAGHSLGEFSALVAAGGMQFADGLKLVSERALAMQAACEATPSTMAAILGMEDADVESVCNGMEGIVVAANYNCPGQLVISGEVPAVEAACEVLKEKGARRALLLPVDHAGCRHLPAPTRRSRPHVTMRTPGVEPGSQAWEACMMPLHYMRSVGLQLPRHTSHDYGIVRNELFF